MKKYDFAYEDNFGNSYSGTVVAEDEQDAVIKATDKIISMRIMKYIKRMNSNFLKVSFVTEVSEKL